MPKKRTCCAVVQVDSVSVPVTDRCHVLNEGTVKISSTGCCTKSSSDNSNCREKSEVGDECINTNSTLKCYGSLRGLSIVKL